MSKDTSSSSASAHPHQSENEFQTSWNHQFPSRPPLNSIPDPSQYNHIHDSHLTSSFLKTPHSQPNSAQTTPIKVSTSPGCTLSRLPLQSSNGVGRSRLFPSRAISTAFPEPLSADVPTFELKEDPLFWQDHNVQVLIRIRPFNNAEIMSQGYRRCLRQESAQTVVWLGHPESRFTFDHIACESVSQEKLFRVAGLPMVDNCMSGYNSCMFAYGQTGSGKTYTMMGEIDKMDGKPSNDCGITPRIFEYLFTKITKEEESRKDEKLTFNCKCSFLEIYNEQITDLLEPSSTNLQLREDLQKGVYVENLTEYNVGTVNDVLKLLQQGAVNRKIAATHMNSESSRSHSVFTCIIESRWEKDSMAHLRFGRLNLVDLAGSERQKSSGAEGDRLREAANINKSLSTLGLVIMSLVDLAHGKHRHVPYRDSRLTFLLQDSLGGNSKTTIIANVSPSTCSANETLSTLKFAQRAKLIQNNAKINEDAPGNVIILQQQIQQLKVQLSFLIKHQHASERIDFAQSPRKYSLGYVPERNELHAEMNMNDEHKTSKGEIMKCDNVHKRLMDAESLIETMKLKQLQLIRKLESFQTENECLKKMLDIKEIPRREDEDKQEEHRTNQSGTDGTIMTALQSKLEKLSRDLKEAEILNRQYVEDHETRSTQDQQTELVRIEVEMETTKAIIQLQEDIDRLQSEFQEQLCSMAEQNLSLQNSVAAKEDELRMFCAEWERATLELTTFLIDGSRSLGDASRQIKCISSSFPIDNGWISERVERAAKICVENEQTILLLQKSLEDAQMTVMEMEQKLYSLKGATIALTEFQQPQKSSSREEIQFSRMLNDPTEEKNFLGNKTLSRKGQILHNQFHAPNLVENISNGTSQLHVLKNESQMQMQMLEHTRNELVEINDRLNSMNACFHKVVNMHCNLDCTEDLTETDGWTTDYSSLCSYSSIGSVDNDDQSSTSERNRCSSKTTEQTLDRISDEGSNLIHRRSVLLLKQELSKTYGAFVKLNNQLMIVYGGKKNQNRVNDILSFPDLHALEKLKEQGSDGHDEPTSQRAEAGSQIFEELAVTEKHSPLSSFFAKFEESYEIIKEADYMLRAMLNANENANMTMAMWKQAREEIMSDKASLTEEIKQLKSCILLRDGEKEVMQDEIQYCLRGKANISSLLDEHLSPMQTGVGELSGTAHGDATQVVEETQGFFCRSSLEDLMCKEMQNDISIFVLQCQMRDHFLKFGRLNTMSNSDKSALLEHSRIAGKLEIGHLSRDNNSAFYPLETEIKGDHIAYGSRREIKELDLVHDDMSNKNSDLKKELERKDILLKGLLFDFSLLQELVSNRNDIKYELEKLIVALSKVQKELELKTMQLDDLLVQNTELQGRLAEAEQALFNSTSELDQAKGTVNILSEQNVELKGLLQDLYLKNSEAEHLLEEQREVIESLEKELIRVSSSSEKQLAPSLKETEENLTRVTADRDELLKKITSLKDKLDVACALADVNQAIAVEARQESEASKMYAEEKEEEVKILEYSVEELESTINVLEKKVQEMEEEVEKQRLIRDSLEVQLQALRNRLLTVEDLTVSMTSEKSSLSVPEDQLSRKLHFKSLEVDEAHGRIKFLEEANTKQAKEIKQFKDYISELVLHAEAQASQFQQKYKTLEAMLHKVNTDSSNVSATPILERFDKISTKTRGSSSPFRCIAGLVQHMNQEKDQELSIARLRIEELEAQAASRHKEVCLLNTRLVTAESMTHDVIRDLLSVKLDLSNYANTIDQHQLQKLIEEAHHQRQEYIAMEHEIVNLRSQIDDLLEERERCISEINKSKSDQLGTQIFVEQLQERDQMLSAQNEMLKVDKSKLQKRVSELDDMVKKLIRMQESQLHNRPQRRNSLSMPFNSDLDERLAHSQKVLSRINNQLAQYSRPDGTCPRDGVDRRGNEVKYRKQKP